MKQNDLKPYKVNRLSKIPTGLKVFVLKSWTAGVVFYFIFMSFEIFNILPQHEDRWLVSGLILILLNEFFINLLIKSMELKKTNQRKHAMLIGFKYSIVANIPYISFVVITTIMLGTLFFKAGVSLSVIFMPSEPATWEPFTFGLLYYIVDSIYILIVRLIKLLINKGKGKKVDEVQ